MPDRFAEHTLAPDLPEAERELPVVVVGAGFSGTLLAINLLRQGGSVVLVERDADRLGRGQAFGTRQVEHLLNVRASNMSAFPGDMTHFQSWADRTMGQEGHRFVPRLAYGHYLHDQLAAALAAAPDRLRILVGEARDATFGEAQVDVHLADGEVIAAKAMVLALGNLVPSPPAPLAGLSPKVLRADPWGPGVADRLDDESHVLLVGTGLTAADVAISLDRAGFGGWITALSRRGLMPRAHAEHGPHVSPVPRPAERGSWLLHAVRMRARQEGWREAVDELRPHTQALWRLHDAAAQARFLRHLRPWWDVHRHRLAPPVAAHVDALIAAGRLSVAAGRIEDAREEDGQAIVTWRERGGQESRQLTVDRVILCTGPEADITRCGEALLGRLVARGMARPDTHRLGLDVDHGARVIGTDGRASELLYAVGPMTKGAEWEIVAVPDIRRQVWTLARVLTNTQWVGGEGL
jgi:uncharacterized NAD(P)/FAD-binding protein YdhS